MTAKRCEWVTCALAALIFTPLAPPAFSSESRPTAAFLEAITAPSTPEAAPRDRDHTAEEDPLAQQQTQANKDAEVAPEGLSAPEPNEVDFYGSLRVRYRWTVRSTRMEPVWGT